MGLGEFFVGAARLGPASDLGTRPLVLIDLNAEAWTGHDVTRALPPCPVIGVGAPDHPLADRLDAVVQPPVALERIAAGVLAHPLAAQIAVQLFRALPQMTDDAGLVAESLAYATLQGSADHVAWIEARKPSSVSLASDAPGRVALVRKGARLVITLNRAMAGNAIDREMRDGLHEAFMLGALDPEIADVSLRASGKAFSLGADLDEFGTTTDPARAHMIRMNTLPAQAAALCADKLDAHVRGACIGAGLELAAWANRFTAAPDAWFQLPELSMGIIPGAGGCVSISRRIGRQRAALMILSGRRFGARQALDWGLIDAIVDDTARDEGEDDIFAR